ncbi:MAG: hypothetical protein ACOH2T_27485 [Pseudomonas sp.]
MAEVSASAPATVDAPIDANGLDLVFKIVSGPNYEAATDLVTYQVEAANNGKTTLISAGKLPVHLGVVIRGSDGTLHSAPANQNFMRVPLPQPLAPGQSITLPITFNAAPTLGGSVIVDAVQEQVGWFSGYNKPVLTLGAFSRCDGVEDTLCLADGTAVAATP